MKVDLHVTDATVTLLSNKYKSNEVDSRQMAENTIATLECKKKMLKEIVNFFFDYSSKQLPHSALFREAMRSYSHMFLLLSFYSIHQL